MNLSRLLSASDFSPSPSPSPFLEKGLSKTNSPSPPVLEKGLPVLFSPSPLVYVVKTANTSSGGDRSSIDRRKVRRKSRMQTFLFSKLRR